MKAVPKFETKPLDQKTYQALHCGPETLMLQIADSNKSLDLFESLKALQKIEGQLSDISFWVAVFVIGKVIKNVLVMLS